MAGVGQALYTLIPIRLLKKYDAKIVTGWAMLIGGLVFMPHLITNANSQTKCIRVVSCVVRGHFWDYVCLLVLFDQFELHFTGNYGYAQLL